MKIRWIDTSCFEIVTDENERIVTDPFIDECDNHPISSDEIEKMDYILITHTHFDHITQVDKYYELYKPKILTSQIASKQLLETFDLSGQLIYGMDHNEEVAFENTRITRISAKHSIPNRPERHFVRESKIAENIKDKFDKKYVDIMPTGYMDFSNFYIETKNNTRILFWGGGVTYEQIQRAKDFRPDIILMQIPSNPKEEIAKLVNLTGASYVFPHHHDTYYKKDNYEEMMNGYKEYIEENCRGVKFISLEPAKWYTFEKQVY